MKKLFFLATIFVPLCGCMTAAQKVKQQADFTAQWNLLTPDQQHQMYYEALKDSYGIGKPAPQPVYYQFPIYVPPHRAQTICTPVGNMTYCNSY